VELGLPLPVLLVLPNFSFSLAPGAFLVPIPREVRIFSIMEEK
jgi:hypothetical protein